VLDSLSRLMPAVAAREHLTRSSQLRTLLSAYARSEDLIRIGAYNPGSDPLLDRAIAVLPELQKFLCQSPEERSPFAETMARLNTLAC
jgi:flagellum-specific ATP synthase